MLLKSNLLFTVVVPGILPLNLIQENDYFVTDVYNPGEIFKIRKNLVINENFKGIYR